MILCDEDCKFLEKIAIFLSDKDIELLFVDDKTMQEINKTHRNIDKSTDVLSFPLQAIIPNLPLGSIVINLDLAKKKAVEFNHSLNDELSLLFIHAMLHLLGYDHEVDEGQMRKKEEELIKYFNLPTSLIIRTLT
ncbi:MULTISPECIES: rRNA maturation RNase YbeY [unclassified Campylobacter]|uniref:rRNA maturation RNase YbeY n=1 Tax=unclassified Campylobacter TaxID=2593542 RepID=UPI0012382721|nr:MULTISPECIES: rRNA maturation RNase YbeY [unclassified Campylobacter]KAA6225171.1 rRNA maturation RNase YbeY [Campylobacter sp. LR196d]KAA6226183.1 rRNA maturation RNase YbeY [Campylobacter sp. LR185c]KAA6229017.1 rRNA maturation RNase YbeY [Campylobacter sp. LR286c]KAA6231384.1 rRNA maturation RNase YbeY [Campylobacter sp. LR264d]KAA6231596.1 rRNA maturation RNase YbeY [Campylobacter sp. LR291e]